MKKVTAMLVTLAMLSSFAASAQTGSAVTQFGLEWMKTESITKTDNAVISPLSAYFALVMLTMGAQGETQRELLNMLGKTLEEAETHAAILMDMISETEGISSANSAWVNEGYKLKDEYAQKLEKELDAQTVSADLGSKETTNRINAWVNEKTNGMIPEILNEPLGADTLLALMNALYFHMDWQKEFDAGSSWPDDFLNDAGKKRQAEFMHKTDSWRYAEAEDGAQLIIMNYKDGKAAFVAVLPPEDVTADEYLKTFTAEKLNAMMNNANFRKISLSFPKIEAQNTHDMMDSLMEMGVERIFDAGLSELGNMIEDRQMYVSLIRQAVRLSLAEEGTEAAAVTIIANKVAAMPIEEPPLPLSFDRSFLYAIVMEETDTALFMGKVTDASLFEAPPQRFPSGRSFADGLPNFNIGTSQSMKTLQADSYSYNCNGLICAEELNLSEIETLKYRSGEYALMQFDMAPDEITVVFRTEDGADEESVNVQNAMFMKMPERGTHIVDVRVKWNSYSDFEAEAHYTFLAECVQ